MINIISVETTDVVEGQPAIELDKLAEVDECGQVEQIELEQHPTCNPSTSANSPMNVGPDVLTPLDVPTDVKAPSSSQKVVVGDEIAVNSQAQASQKSLDGRHVQKTRSFSAVEDVPAKKIPVSKSKELKEFLAKDVAHSRSEHLEVQQQSGQDETSDGHSDPKALSAGHDNAIDRRSANKLAIIDGDSLIKEYDYHDQPASLQYDTTSVKIPSESRASSDVRKSGRDLTELGLEIIRDRLNKNDRAHSRPRLDSKTYPQIPAPLSLQLNTYHSSP